MAIFYEDIKLMKSERLDDTPEGGGRMTGEEVIDGEMNNLFPDVSRLDRVYGRVNLRKAFPAVMSLNADPYYGSHLVITRPPVDRKIKCTMFTRHDSLDRRAEAVNFLQSYQTPAYRRGGYLVGFHPAGLGVLTVFCPPGSDIFRVNQVVYLVDYSGGSLVDGDGHAEFVRISEADFQEKEVMMEVDGKIQAVKVVEWRLTLERPLQFDHSGSPLSPVFYPADGTYLYDTVVGASARFYGIAPLIEPASVGDFTVKVESIFSNVVPTARSEIALADRYVSGQQVGLFPISYTEQTETITVSSGDVIRLPFAVVPRTVGGDFTDSPKNERYGDLLSGTTVVGQIDYYEGTIEFASSFTGASLAYIPALDLNVFTYTAFESITQETQRNTFVKTLLPFPSAFTVEFHYRSQGNWYVLRDDGTGTLRGSDPAIGSGTFNYDTGTLTVSTGALPDVDSAIMYRWATVPHITLAAPEQSLSKLFYRFKLDTFVPVSGLQIDYIANGASKSVSDDGSGNLQGDGQGSVLYQNGEIIFYPTEIPDAATQITVTVSAKETVRESGAKLEDDWNDAEPYWAFETGNAIEPGSVVIRYNVNIVRPITELRFIARIDPPVYARDDGSGNLINMFGDQVGTVDYTNGSILLAKIQPYHEYLPGELETNVFSSESFLTSYRTDPTQIYKPEFTNRLAASLVASYRTRPPLTREEVVIGTNRFRRVYRAGYIEVNPKMAYALSYVIDGTSENSQTWTYDARPILLKVDYEDFKPLPRTFSFEWNGNKYYESNGDLLKGFDVTTGEYGDKVGEYDEAEYAFKLTSVQDGVTNTEPTGVIGAFAGLLPSTSLSFLVDVTPVAPGTFQLVFPDLDGNLRTVTADLAGVINDDFCIGEIDVLSGLVKVRFGKWIPHQTEYETEDWFKPELLNEDGTQVFVPYMPDVSRIRYNAVGYKSIPLDPSILGLDPIRLPPDGRVPVFHIGDVVVIHNIQQTTLPNPVEAGQTYDLGRTNLSYVDIFDQEGRYVNRNLFSVDLDNGTVTFADPLDLSGYTQPLIAYHRREDMRLVSDVQVSGHLTFTEAIDHDYLLDGNSFVSSALLMGDLQAKVLNVFDQKNWYGTFSDELEGDPAEATFNIIDYPIEVTNKGSIQERWAIVFTSSTNFKVIGENVGVIATGDIYNDLAPINPATNEPYFYIRKEGWGTGWQTNNVLRFNTTAAHFPVWFVRTVLQGDPEGEGDSFKVQIRGDVD